MRILIIVAVAIFLVAWVRTVVDVVRRPDLTVGAKLGWSVFMLVLPLIGILVYVMARPADSQIAQRSRR